DRQRRFRSEASARASGPSLFLDSLEEAKGRAGARPRGELGGPLLADRGQAGPQRVALQFVDLLDLLAILQRVLNGLGVPGWVDREGDRFRDGLLADVDRICASLDDHLDLLDLLLGQRLAAR